ncbi:TRAP transporter small permease [Sneathiella sp.]|uniref:TRAP transporter small permease n=1 Tax=Sneathiella sp. TaxID=1964365 RepID=UPI0026222930|nr:TRAP transporter small permease [Sneathiella sp.]MDF2368477.1 TRAP transporter small permease [Sneathiella sp.]
MESSPESKGPWVLRKLEGALVALSIFCILGICAVINITIFGRFLFGLSIPDDVVMVRELMIGAVVLPLAYVAAGRAHIMVEVFTGYMPESWQPALNLLGSLTGSLMLLPVLYGGYLDFESVASDGAYFFGELNLPEWPGRLIFLVGYITFVLRLFVLTGEDALEVFRTLTGHSAPPAEKG